MFIMFKRHTYGQKEFAYPNIFKFPTVDEVCIAFIYYIYNFRNEMC